MGVYRKLAILTRGTLRYARGTLASTLEYATSTLPYFNFFLTGTVCHLSTWTVTYILPTEQYDGTSDKGHLCIQDTSVYRTV